MSKILIGEIEKLKPFPEVPSALSNLQAKYKLVVLSNGDPDMLETAKKYHKIPFDRLISVAEANSFKPHVGTYTKAAELIGVKLESRAFAWIFDLGRCWPRGNWLAVDRNARDKTSQIS